MNGGLYSIYEMTVSNLETKVHFVAYVLLRRSRQQMGIFQYECMISAASPSQNVGCERCLLNCSNAVAVGRSLEIHCKPSV